VPSDFFSSRQLWTEAFPLYRPFELGHACQFHIMDKDIDFPAKDGFKAVLDPPDADHLYSAKVLAVT
jgi:hypothetical protein